MSYVIAISKEKTRNFKMYKKELPRNGLVTRIQSSTNSSPYSILLKKNLIICPILIDF